VIDGVSVCAYKRDSHTGRCRQPGKAAWIALAHALKHYMACKALLRQTIGTHFLCRRYFRFQPANVPVA
jgi:hypothetical protein